MESKVLDNYGRVVCTLTPLDGICILAASQIEEGPTGVLLVPAQDVTLSHENVRNLRDFLNVHFKD